MSRWDTGTSQVGETSLYDAVTADAGHHARVKSRRMHNTEAKLHVNCGLQLVVTRQHAFISCNKEGAPVAGVSDGGLHLCVWWHGCRG